MLQNLKKNRAKGNQSLNSEAPMRLPMVSWYSLRQLWRTGVNVAISLALGTRSDVRLIEAQGEASHFIDYEFCYPDGDFWFDYMADTGDGWEPTYAMAGLLTQDCLIVQRNDREHVLPRGKFLVLGGDEVYPCASRLEYRRRLVGPFEQAKQCSAFSHVREAAHLYAIPGNHDWYDGLVSFMRQFQQRRHVGIWKTNQERSYFALKLPHNWWLWGVDTQLESDIDWPQVKFFRRVAESMEDHDRLILCTAEPYWIYADLRKEEKLNNNLNFLLGSKVLGHKRINPYLYLSGDLHIYRRHYAIDDPNRQRIVSGGGGAFVHPTHNGRVEEITLHEADPSEARGSTERFLDPEKEKTEGNQGGGIQEINAELGDDDSGEVPLVPRNYKQADDQFPPEKSSKCLAFRNLLFGYYNPTFGIVTAVVYAVIGPALMRPSLAMLLIVLGICALCIRFCDDLNRKRFRYVWGAAHGAAHLMAAFGIASCAAGMVATDASLVRTVLSYSIIGAGGYILGPIILGIYLLISLNCFKMHHSEAFSALRNPNYKNFLRIRISKGGSLTIYPIGVPTPTSVPVLIEGPITIEPGKRVDPLRKT